MEIKSLFKKCAGYALVATLVSMSGCGWDEPEDEQTIDTPENTTEVVEPTISISITDIGYESVTVEGSTSKSEDDTETSFGIIYAPDTNGNLLKYNPEEWTYAVMVEVKAASSAPGLFSITLNDLVPGTYYCYCTYIKSGEEYTYSNIACFTTLQPEVKVNRLYICGDLMNGSEVVSFLTPSPSNRLVYDEYFSLTEPEGYEGEDLFVGCFTLDPRRTEIEETPVMIAQFRFFTDLMGWSHETTLGSHEADFYVLPVANNYDGEIVEHGWGNWGVYIGTPTPFTFVVDKRNLKLYFREGNRKVSFTGRTPSFY